MSGVFEKTGIGKPSAYNPGIIEERKINTVRDNTHYAITTNDKGGYPGQDDAAAAESKR
jgi:hypothetical protein